MRGLSLNDLFVVGLGLDITGAWLLGHGLLVSPADMVRRAGTFPGSNPWMVVSAAEDKVDGYFGLGGLLAGFALQAVAYTLTIGSGGGDETGWNFSLIALSLAVVVSGTVYVAWRRLRRRLVLWVLLGPARVDINDGTIADKPFAPSLNGYATVLGYELREGEDGPAYARRVFPVTDVYPRGHREPE